MHDSGECPESRRRTKKRPRKRGRGTRAPGRALAVSTTTRTVTRDTQARVSAHFDYYRPDLNQGWRFVVQYGIVEACSRINNLRDFFLDSAGDDV